MVYVVIQSAEFARKFLWTQSHFEDDVQTDTENRIRGWGVCVYSSSRSGN
jgi:hypothetical protein